MDANNRFVHALSAWSALLAGALTFALVAGPAAGATECAQRVIDDWSDNGRIDQLYRLHCYDEAIEAIPVDLRDYTNAADIIQRALTTAVRQGSSTGVDATGARAPKVDTSGASAPPLPLMIFLGVSLVVLAAGAAGYWSRRRRGGHSA